MEQWYLSTIDPHAADIARGNGFGIEIADYCTPWNLDEDFEKTDTVVRQAVDGIADRILHGPFNELFPSAIDPKARELARERFCQAVNLAAEYGAKKVVLHGGFYGRLYYPCWFTEQSILFWKDFLPEIPDGMTVCVENVLEETPDLLLAVVKAVDSKKIRLCLDIGHVHAYSGIPVEEWIRQYGTWLSHVHVHNNDGSADTHSVLTEGTMDISTLVRQIRLVQPDATYTLELPDAADSVRWLLDNRFFR